MKYCHAPENPHVYYRKFEDIHFPTDNFDRVVCWDVLEHVLNPLDFLKEIFRVLDQHGTFFAEVPLFFDKKGKDHWKRNEHVWYFTPEQLEKLLKRAGFCNIRTERGWEGKILFIADKPEQHRASLLLPPGIGDVYWPLVKAQALLKREGITSPVDAFVAAPRERHYDGHARAFPFLRMFPFLYSTGEVRFNRRDPIWREAYLQTKRSVFENIHGCDWFITWNGYLRAGKTLEEVDPDLECNWFLPRFISLVEENYRKDSIDKYGDYLALYWVFRGSNGTILKHFSLKQIAEVIHEVVRVTKLTPVLVGAIWDLNDDPDLNELLTMLPKNTVDLRAKTTVEELFGFLRGAKTVFGMNSGITIMAAAFRLKMVMLVHDYLFTGGTHRNFAWNTVPPEVRKKTYFAEHADSITPEGLAARVISLVNDTPFARKRSYVSSGEVLHTTTPRRRRTRRKEAITSIRAVIQDEPKPKVKVADRPVRRKPLHRKVPVGPITIMCVLKSGGIFDINYVERLRNMVARHVTIPYQFICLSDVEIPKDVCASLKLKRGYPGSWAKVEMFRPELVEPGRMVYFDLDSIILANINDVLNTKHNFIGLKPWNKSNRGKGLLASGMMAWTNDGVYSFIYEQFASKMIKEYPAGDQEWISRALMAQGEEYSYYQDVVPGIYSYKRDCRPKKPNDARIVCFHGRPRPHEVEVDWVKENWR